ncbi:MAG: recombinase family protein, partial [Cyanobacteria bacterium J06632_22]
MTSVAYLYSDPLLGPPQTVEQWPHAIEHLYQDFAIDRPQLKSLLARVEDSPPAERPEYLLVTSLESLAETLTELTDRLHQLDNLGITLLTVAPEATANHPMTITVSESPASEPAATESLPSPLSILLATVQQRQQQRRLQRGHARNRLQALPPPGKAPYGYRRTPQKYELDKSAVPVVKAFFEQFVLYGSLRGAVRYIDRRYGKRISPSTGKRWLTSPVYRGHTAYKDGQTMLNTHAAILPPDEAAQVDRLLRRNRSLPPRTASAPRSLSGLVRCQACGSTMTVSRVSAPRREKAYLYLQPAGCPRQPHCAALQYNAVLQKTIETICTELPKLMAQLPAVTGSQKADLEQRILQKQQLIEQLPQWVNQGVLDETTAALRRYTLQNEIAIAQQALAQLPPVNLQELFRTVSLPQFWQDLSE